MLAHSNAARWLLTFLVLLSTTLAEAENPDLRCYAPAIVVPTPNVNRVLKVCVDQLERGQVHAMDSVNSLLFMNSCEASHARASELRNELTCISAELGIGSAITSQARKIAPIGPDDNSANVKCVASEALFEKAAAAGSPEAEEHFFLALTQGYANGCSANVNLALAAQHMLRGAKLGSSYLQATLARVMLVIRSPDAYVEMDVLHDKIYSKLASSLSGNLPEPKSEAILSLLNDSAQSYETTAIKDLVELYSRGTLGKPRAEYALAWAAIDSVRDEYPTQDRTQFRTLYERASPADRARACKLLKKWSSDNVNFRLFSADVRNEFVRECFVGEAIVKKAECVSESSLTRIEGTLKPYIQEHPDCQSMSDETSKRKD